MAEVVSLAVRKALTDSASFEKASDDVLSECWMHIHDAIRQVQDAPSAQDRKAMLAKLPPHIRSRVEEWVKAFWGVEVMACADIGAEMVVLPLCGITALVRKKGP